MAGISMYALKAMLDWTLDQRSSLTIDGECIDVTGQRVIEGDTHDGVSVVLDNVDSEPRLIGFTADTDVADD